MTSFSGEHNMFTINSFVKIPREKVEYGFHDPKLENKGKQQWINERLAIKKPIKKDEYQSGHKIDNDFFY